MDRQTVIERKTRLDGTTTDYACTALVVEPGRRAVLRYVIDREWKVGDLTLGPGTHTIGHFWVDRPYNVYHWLAPEGRTIGFYVNVADRTEIDRGLVTYRDLAVDVLIKPSGALDVLDEDEVPPDLEPAARRTIAEALEVVITAGRRLMAEVEQESRKFA